MRPYELAQELAKHEFGAKWKEYPPHLQEAILNWIEARVTKVSKVKFSSLYSLFGDKRKQLSEAALFDPAIIQGLLLGSLAGAVSLIIGIVAVFTGPLGFSATIAMINLIFTTCLAVYFLRARRWFQPNAPIYSSSRKQAQRSMLVKHALLVWWWVSGIVLAAWPIVIAVLSMDEVLQIAISIVYGLLVLIGIAFWVDEHTRKPQKESQTNINSNDSSCGGEICVIVTGLLILLGVISGIYYLITEFSTAVIVISVTLMSIYCVLYSGLAVYLFKARQQSQAMLADKGKYSEWRTKLLELVVEDIASKAKEVFNFPSIRGKADDTRKSMSPEFRMQMQANGVDVYWYVDTTLRYSVTEETYETSRSFSTVYWPETKTSSTRVNEDVRVRRINWDTASPGRLFFETNGELFFLAYGNSLDKRFYTNLQRIRFADLEDTPASGVFAKGGRLDYADKLAEPSIFMDHSDYWFTVEDAGLVSTIISYLNSRSAG